MAFSYILDVPVTIDPCGLVDVHMDFSNEVVANLLTFSGIDDIGDVPDNYVEDQQDPEQTLICSLNYDRQTKKWKVIAGKSLSEKDIQEISEELSDNLEQWEKSEW